MAPDGAAAECGECKPHSEEKPDLPEVEFSSSVTMHMLVGDGQTDSWNSAWCGTTSIWKNCHRRVHPVLAKHSKSFSLIDCISVGVDSKKLLVIRCEFNASG